MGKYENYTLSLILRSDAIGIMFKQSDINGACMTLLHCDAKRNCNGDIILLLSLPNAIFQRKEKRKISNFTTTILRQVLLRLQNILQNVRSNMQTFCCSSPRTHTQIQRN